MTDFAKEARDLPDFAEASYAITAVFRGEHMDDAAMTVIDRRVTDALRRMHAEGVRAGMARAAEIARPPVQMAVMALSAIKGTYDLHKNMRKDVHIALDGLRAILAAAPAKGS